MSQPERMECLASSQAEDAQPAQRVSTGIRHVLDPVSVAVIGASADPKRVGGMTLDYLQRAGYRGRIFAVNPNHASVQGVVAYPNIGAIDEEVELAVIAVPAESVVPVLRDCGNYGTKAAIVLSAGFAEIGGRGDELQAEITTIARETGMRVCGPNCAGVISPSSGLAATFGSHLAADARLMTGDIGLVSQSGAVGALLFTLARRAELGFSHWVTTGNEADTELADYVGYLANDASTRVIGLFVEQIRDGDKFLRACATARDHDKRIVSVRTGRTARGRQAVFSHTGAIVGAAGVVDAALSEAGVVQVASVDELLDCLRSFGRGGSARRAKGRRIGLLTISGGIGGLMADACGGVELDVPELTERTQREMREILPYAATGNPVDVTGNVGNTPEVYRQFLDLLLADPQIDAVIAFLGHVTLSPYVGERLVTETAHAQKGSRKPIWLVALDTPTRTVERLAEEAGIPVFEDPSRCVTALSRAGGGTEDEANRVSIDVQARRQARTASLKNGADLDGRPEGLVSEMEAWEILQGIGIDIPRQRLVQSAEAARDAAGEIGGQVVVKAVVEDLAHKFDVGAVAVGVPPSEAGEAYERVTSNVRSWSSKARVEGVLVQEEITSGIEVIIGSQRESAFGPAIMVGAGGVLAELTDDQSIALAPLGPSEAEALVKRTRVGKLLEGYRGQAGSNRRALSQMIERISMLAWLEREQIVSIDLNPVIVNAERAVAVDVLIEIGPSRKAEG